MPDLLLTSIEYSGYISIIKFVIFLILFFLWLPLVNWVNSDAKSVETNPVMWTAIIFGTGAVAAIIWLLVPVFIIGMLLYLIALGAASMAYISHRNARVTAFDRVLTIDHLKGLLVSKEKRLEAQKGFVFITTNDNEVPPPQPKTADYFGYTAAYELFTDAEWRRADKVMLVPAADDYSVIYEVDGAALKQPAINKEQMGYLIRFLKNLADLNIKEKRKPQRGRFRISREKQKCEWEVVTAGSTAGEQVQLRHKGEGGIKRLADTGLTDEQYNQLNQIRELKQGIFIISGPKKSGVTSTFYALIRNHDAFLNSISTLEKEPSGELPNVTQEVFSLSDTGTTTYAKKLRAIVRMGPDIVGAGNCEDSETAQVVCGAAEDGKIIYITLEADNVVGALNKWVELIGDKSKATGSLLGISNQRLLRKLCDECKQGYSPNQELLRKFNLPAERAKVFYRPGKVIYDKHGKARTCENCQGTGFVGRVGVFETIIMNDELRKAVMESASSPEINTQLRKAKMLYLQEQALRKVIAGTTAVKEMIRVFSRPKKRK